METPQSQPTFLDVTYYPGATVYGALRARFEWTSDDRLKLTTVEGTPEAPQYNELFNIPATDITRVRSIMDEITIFTNQGKFRTSVAANSSAAVAVGGVPGMFLAHSMYKNSGASSWIERLKAHGVSVRRIGYGATFAICAGVVAAILAVIVAAILLADS